MPDPTRLATLRSLRDDAAEQANRAQADHAALAARAKAGHTVLAHEWTKVGEALARTCAERDAYALACWLFEADEPRKPDHDPLRAATGIIAWGLGAFVFCWLVGLIAYLYGR